MQVTIAMPACATPSNPARSKVSANFLFAASRSSKASLVTGTNLLTEGRGTNTASAEVRTSPKHRAAATAAMTAQIAAPRKIACSCSMPACSISRVYAAHWVFPAGHTW